MTAQPGIVTQAAPPLTLVLSAAASRFSERLAGLPGARTHDVPDYAERARLDGTLAKPVRWTNLIISNPRFRRAHVERFEIGDQIAVLHVCIFPRPDTGLPIFGFDVVAGQSRITGAFLDLSPTDPTSDDVSRRWAHAVASRRDAFSEHRTLPEWGDVFSKGVIAIRPTTQDEVDAVFDLGLASLDWLLRQAPGQADTQACVVGQRRYIDRQRENEHTFRMLRGCVGDALARDFIDCWLFPDPTDPSDA